MSVTNTLISTTNVETCNGIGSVCSLTRWSRTSLSKGQLSIWSTPVPLAKTSTNRYFHLDSSLADPVKLQQGVIRTNCMDNLDRTNVAQAALAKWILNRQLRSLHLLVENDHIDNYDDINKDFRESMYSPSRILIDKADQYAY